MSGVISIVGETVQTKSGTVAVSSFAQKGKVVGLYFSAHWCPPCRGFTPVLAEFYQNRKAKGDFEIIFVSLDRDEASFKEYFGTMPWSSLQWSDGKELQSQLSEKYGVSGIPSLVLLDGETGQLITDQARGKVQEDPAGANFPWK